MSSKEEILARIRQNTGTRYEKPDIAAMKRLAYPDKIEQFCAVSRAVGGTAVVLGEGEDVNAVIRRNYPDAMRIASVLPDISCATFNPDNLDDPKELDGTDVAVIKGEIGVAENGAIWIPQEVKYKALYFISERLVILIDRNKIQCMMLIVNWTGRIINSVRSSPVRQRRRTSNRRWLWEHTGHGKYW